VIYVLLVSANIEPKISGQRQQSLHELPVDLNGALKRVRFHPAVPVGFISGIDQHPEHSGYRFKNLQQAPQLLAQLNAALDVRTGTEKPS
jgi:hypothetical protein